MQAPQLFRRARRKIDVALDRRAEFFGGVHRLQLALEDHTKISRDRFRYFGKGQRFDCAGGEDSCHLLIQ